MKILVRNTTFVPFLENEGEFRCPMPTPNTGEKDARFNSLSVYDRLYYHQTLASVRSCKRFKPNPAIPKDSLDFQLQSRYNHTKEMFAEKVDMVMQRETCSQGEPTFRVLRNTMYFQLAEKPSMGHPLVIAALKERMSPYSVKLINSGPHSQQTNNGFSRQPGDGNFFRY